MVFVYDLGITVVGAALVLTGMVWNESPYRVWSEYCIRLKDLSPWSCEAYEAWDSEWKLPEYCARSGLEFEGLMGTLSNFQNGYNRNRIYHNLSCRLLDRQMF